MPNKQWTKISQSSKGHKHTFILNKGNTTIKLVWNSKTNDATWNNAGKGEGFSMQDMCDIKHFIAPHCSAIRSAILNK